MPLIYVLESPDPSLAWLLYLLLAFLLVSIVVGAIVGPHVLNGRVPGALQEKDETEPAGRQKAAEK